MTTMIKNVAFVALTLTFGCATPAIEGETEDFTAATELVQTTGDASEQMDNAHKALFVLSGGYESCGTYGPHAMNSYQSFRMMLKELGDRYPQLDAHFLVTCLGDDAPPGGLAYFHVDGEPELFWTTSLFLPEVIDQLAPQDTSIYLIGHSYGGWLSMLNLINLEDQYDRTSTSLFTLDPISPNGCDDNAFYNIFGGGFDTMFNFATGGMFGSWFTNGCREAPQDMPSTLAQNTEHYNFYQRNGGYLQSGPMYGAYNMELPGESHTSIAWSHAVWAAIGTAISADLDAD